MLEISQRDIRKIELHGENSYPHECCGILIGNSTPASNLKVVEAYPVQNINKVNARVRYDIDPLVLLKVENEANSKGLDIIGIYHSHPDHPAQPSSTDLKLAWPNLSYIVTSIHKGHATKTTSWRLHDSRHEFIPEEMHISEFIPEEMHIISNSNSNYTRFNSNF